MSDAWRSPDEPPRLAEHEAHVWRVIVPGALPRAWLDALSPDERDTLHRFRRDADGVRFATGRAAVRLLLGMYLGCPARAIVFDRTCRHCGANHGKPRVANLEQLDFNLSSSGQVALIAVARGCEVGVDVEAIPRGDPAEVAELALSPAEYRSFVVDVSPERASEPVQTWCYKEAVLKATGLGLGLDPRHLVVARHEDAFRVLEAPPGHDQLRAYTIARLALESGYVGAIALSPFPARLQLFDVSPDSLLGRALPLA
jgi:4'-phosphopantetheinyl transferase